VNADKKNMRVGRRSAPKKRRAIVTLKGKVMQMYQRSDGSSGDAVTDGPYCGDG
jgi:hypothetical protein